MAGYKSSGQARQFNRIQLRPVRSGQPGELRSDPSQRSQGKFGTSHIIALALAMLDLRVVHRRTLRALVPTGKRQKKRSDASIVAARLSRGARPTSSDNNVTDQFQKALVRFDRDGLISRGQDFVLVRNSRGLFDWAMSVEWPEEVTIGVRAAIAEVERALREDRSPAGVVEQRRQELIRLKALMEEGFGEHWSGRGSVRFVPRGRLL